MHLADLVRPRTMHDLIRERMSVFKSWFGSNTILKEGKLEAIACFHCRIDCVYGFY